MAHITITPVQDRVTVRWNGRVVVDTTKAVELKEGTYSPVLYLPREDADMSLLAPTERQTTCPYKGQASYFSLRSDAAKAENVVWSYEHPKEGVEEIAGRLAFYPDKVEIERKTA